MSLYAAIDLHSSNSVLAVMDGEGKALLQCRRPNDLRRLLSDLAPYREELVGVAVESTYNWYWLVDGLVDHGYAVRLVNTTAIPQYDGLKHGDDHTDALHLAQLMRLGLLPDKWKKGQRVYIIKVNGIEYIKTVDNGKEQDNLENLPEF